jgi:hypothetical protein
MGINWSAVAGGIGEAVNYHVDKRDEERKRKKAFEDAAAMAEINFGYSKQLAGIDAAATVEAARLSAAAKEAGYSYIDLPALGKWAPAKRVRHTGQTDEMRFSNKNEVINNHFRPLFRAVKNGDLSQADASALLKDNGATFFIAEHMQDQHIRRTVPNTQNDRTAPAGYAVHSEFFNLDFSRSIIDGLRDGVRSDAQKAQADLWNNSIGDQSNVPTHAATFWGVIPINSQNPLAFKLASTPAFRQMQTQVKNGELTDPTVLTSAAKNILGEAAETLSGKEIEKAISDAFVYSGQRNSIDRNKIVPNIMYPIRDESETRQQRVVESRNFLGAIERGAGVLINRKPLVTPGGVAAQSLSARFIGSFTELGDMIGINPKTNEFNLGLNDNLLSKLTEQVGMLDVEGKGQAITNIVANNEALNKFMEQNKNPDGTYTSVALDTYQLRMEQMIIAYSAAKFFGDSRVSNQDFNNVFVALFGTFNSDPTQQAKDYTKALMVLHNLVSKQVESDTLSSMYAKRIGAENKEYDISVGSGARQFQKMLRAKREELVNTGQVAEFWKGIIPDSQNSPLFVQPTTPEVNLTTRQTGAAAAAADADARPVVKPN